jgi:hypothetical protein
MATVTERPRTPNLVESHRKVRDPLHHLRGLIRRYVITEALTTLLICLAVCFWLGLLLDYGFFKLFGIDWVQDLPRWFRALLLGGGLLVICFVVELRKAMKIRATLAAHGAVATDLPDSLTASRQFRLIRIGAGLLLYGMVLAFATIGLFLGALFVAFRGGSDAVGLTLTAAFLATAVGSGLLSFVGKLVCLSSSEPARGRGAISIAVACDVLGVLLALVAVVLGLPPVLYLMQPILSLVGFVSFMIYLREAARYLGRPDLARAATVLLQLGIGSVVQIVLGVCTAFIFPLVGLGLIAASLVANIVWVFLYYRLLRGLAGGQRNPLLTAVGVPVVLLYLAAWVAIALLLDSGRFVPLVVGLMVFALLAAFVALVVVKRLLYEFRDEALALVLEKRYPELLGDRLITAVELHNPAEAEQLGYSPVMVEETIHEAAKRVAKLPVREVFDWKRLYLQGGSAIGLTVGVYLLTVLGLVGLASARDDSTGNVVIDVNRAAGIWFERNVMLDNERWPKRALLQPVGFPESGELKVGKGTSSVPLHARAIEYAIHDRSVPDRWRAVTLRDLREKDLGISDIPEDEELFPRGEKPRDEEAGFSLDEVKLRLDSLKRSQERTVEESKMALFGLFFGGANARPVGFLLFHWEDLTRNAKLMEKPQALIEQVDQVTADNGGLSRGLRKLIVPDEVTVKYRGANHRGEVTLDKIANNEYKGKIEELSESISFTLRAEDFVSDARLITVVPPPRVVTLELEESAPAYLYYLAEKDTRPLPFVPLDRDQLLFAGKKQASKPITRSVAGESQPEIRLLTSSDLNLRIITDKPLDPDTIKLDTKGSPFLRGVTPKVIDKHAFEITLHNVRGKLDFRFTFSDTDGVPGAQELLVTPTEDESPVIQQFKPEVVRMVGDRYMITPEALIPFSFVIRDDYGLARLRYNYTLTEAPAPDEELRRFARVAGSIGLSLSGPEVPLSALVYNQALPITLQRNEATLDGRFPVAHFQAIINALRADMNEADIAKALRQRVAVRKLRDREPLLTAYVFKEVTDLDPYLKDHKAAVDDPAVPTKGFDVALIRRPEGDIEMPLKARELEVQKRYYLQVYLEAFDSNIERAGRGMRPSKQYPFVIVSDTELLYEIGKEEERLYDELRKSYDELVKTREQMDSLRSDIPSNAAELQKDNFEQFSVRTEAIDKAIREGLRITVKVALDYDRIYREMRTNRIQNSNPKRINDTYELIVKPLAGLQENEFRYSQAELTRLRKVLDNSALNDGERLKKARDMAKLADEQVQLLVTKLGEVLAQMRGVVDYNKVKDLIRELERKEAESAGRLKKLHDELTKRLFEGLDIDEAPKKKPEGEPKKKPEGEPKKKP